MSNAPREEWTTILSRLNSLLLKSDRWREALTPESLSTRWCGLPPATEREILSAEERLGITLPPSYRSFLAISNGWRPFSNFIERLLPVQEIDQFRSADPEALTKIQANYRQDDLPEFKYLDYENPEHNEALRHRYYPDSLLIGKPWGYESDMILLNPAIVFPDGEWEAIFFANWIPGNRRFRSFRELVQNSVESLEKIERF